MTWRIRIEPNVLVDGISIQIGRRLDDGGVVQLTYVADQQVHTAAEAAATMAVPSLTVDDDLGRALLDALAGYYGGTTGGLQQRADFEHERRRVDKLIAHLTGASA